MKTAACFMFLTITLLEALDSRGDSQKGIYSHEERGLSEDSTLKFVLIGVAVSIIISALIFSSSVSFFYYRRSREPTFPQLQATSIRDNESIESEQESIPSIAKSVEDDADENMANKKNESKPTERLSLEQCEFNPYAEEIPKATLTTINRVLKSKRPMPPIEVKISVVPKSEGPPHVEVKTKFMPKDPPPIEVRSEVVPSIAPPMGTKLAMPPGLKPKETPKKNENVSIDVEPTQEDGKISIRLERTQELSPARSKKGPKQLPHKKTDPKPVAVQGKDWVPDRPEDIWSKETDDIQWMNKRIE